MPASIALGSRLPAIDRRRQLLETALDLFSRKGFQGATTKEIAAAAGVTEAIIFRHFPSKQALYTAVLDYRHESEDMQDWLAETKGCMERKDDAGLMGAIARKIIQAYRRDPRLQRVLLFAALEGHEEGLAHHRQLSIPVFEQLCDYVRRRQNAGALSGYEAGMIVAAIAGMAAYFAMMTEMFGFPIAIPDNEVAEIFTSILMNGIRPKRNRKLKSSK
ncbi:MAG TPA: TetR/AcrR family transcriptional regulator [Candidatus Sulfopaludibacter sp.]|nr:TetR/AcrR family transcriptional regulator [Candidatus Sulfopaludibacter sp.]